MQKIYRALKAIRECNKPLLHAKNETDLIAKCCDIVVHTAGYRMVWIGYAERNNSKMVRPVAQAGFEEEYLNKIKVSWADNEYKQCPAGAAIRMASPKVVQNILAEPQNELLREEAKIRGYNSSVAIPLIFDDQVLGVLNLYATEPDAFDEEETHLLTDLANNLAYGIVAFRVNEEKKRKDEKLQLESMLFENSMEGVMVTDINGIIEIVNPAFTAVTGYRADECVGKNSNILKSNYHDKEFFKKMWDSLIKNGYWQGEIWNRRKNGEAYPAQLTIFSMKNPEGKIIKYASVFHDITDSKRSEEEIKYQAYHDALTGLPNRLLFIDHLKEAVARARRSRRMLAVLFLDLDNFKNVNDILGHATGDLLLKEAAARLVDSCREVDTISRLGGDEFIILMENLGKEQDAVKISRKIIDALSRPFSFKGEDIFVTSSIGISLYPADTDTVEGLMKNADLAMYHAKGLGKGNYQFFTNEMNERVVKRLKMEKGLRNALEKKEMVVYYQPKVETKTRQIVGMEALMRWVQPDGTIISPAEFIPLAGETGLIVKLDEWMLQTACSFAQKINATSLNLLPVSINVSVNLSAIVLERKDLVDTVTKKVREAGLQPQHVELEVTESSIIRDVESAIDTIQRLRDRGFNVSMDDFGTGYSSLSYLTKLPINILKIDRSFIVGLPSNPSVQSVTKAIITMAHDMNIKVIAEGVETQAQLDFLQKVGCDEIQGFLFSRPLPSNEMIELLKKGKSLPVKVAAL